MTGEPAGGRARRPLLLLLLRAARGPRRGRAPAGRAARRCCCRCVRRAAPRLRALPGAPPLLLEACGRAGAGARGDWGGVA
jgi:hypothetical protein